MTTRRIPLFPLNVVLFPGTVLPLHIFEPRYKRMIRDVMASDEPFGVVLSRENGMATTGCTATVRRVARNYEDGRMDVLTLGESAYRIGELHKGNEYLEATVELLPDDSQTGSPTVAKELITLFVDCHLLLHDSPSADIDMEDLADALLSYRIASDLPLELDTLQELLETRMEAERRTKLVNRLNQLLPQLVQIQQMRSKAVASRPN
jgi:ATP-dependent Lon protease